MLTYVATTVCVVIALLAAALSGGYAALNRPPAKVLLAAAALTEVTVLVFDAVRVVDLVGGHHTSSLGLVIAYLVGLLLTLPVSTALGVAEPSRWGSAVMATGALVVCVLVARVHQLWSPHG